MCIVVLNQGLFFQHRIKKTDYRWMVTLGYVALSCAGISVGLGLALLIKDLFFLAGYLFGLWIFLPAFRALFVKEYVVVGYGGSVSYLSGKKAVNRAIFDLIWFLIIFGGTLILSTTLNVR